MVDVPLSWSLLPLVLGPVKHLTRPLSSEYGRVVLAEADRAQAEKRPKILECSAKGPISAAVESI